MRWVSYELDEEGGLASWSCKEAAWTARRQSAAAGSCPALQTCGRLVTVTFRLGDGATNRRE